MLGIIIFQTKWFFETICNSYGQGLFFRGQSYILINLGFHIYIEIYLILGIFFLFYFFGVIAFIRFLLRVIYFLLYFSVLLPYIYLILDIILLWINWFFETNQQICNKYGHGLFFSRVAFFFFLIFILQSCVLINLGFQTLILKFI